jgi:hypothetical protein
MEEIWKPIKGYEERYSISNLGNVKSNEQKELTLRQNQTNYITIND